MTDLKIDMWLTALKEIVIYNSAEQVCHRLNSFAIIDDEFDWDKDSIEARTEKPFYFSRDKQRLLYPAAAVSFDKRNMGNYRGEKYNDYCHSLVLGIVDQIVTDCKTCTPCQLRTKTQIYLDTGDLLVKLINAASNINLYKTLKGVDVGFKYAHPDVMALLISEGIFDSAIIEKSESGIYKNMWEINNLAPDFFDMRVTKQKTLATYVRLKVCEFCSESEMNFTFKKYENQNCC